MEKTLKKLAKTEYKRLIGSLWYVSTKTRPNITFAVNQAKRFSENPTKADLNASIRILKYLKCTKYYSINYNGKKIIGAYCDIDFAGDEIKIRSTSGYIFVLRNNPISWKSITQKNIALSTTEAEYSSLIELIECIKQATWIRRLVNEIFNQNIRINIRIDNKPCKDIAENENQKGKIQIYEHKIQICSWWNYKKNEIKINTHWF